MSDNETLSTQAEEVVEQIKPILAVCSPQMHGAVLANLVAIWLAGLPHDDRTAAMTVLLNTVFKLVPIEEHDMFGDHGHPRSLS
jgi:hypothetical protein